MTDPTNSVAEQAAPEAVRWAVNVHRVARQRQDKIQADIAAMDAKLAELSKYAAEIASNRAAASEELEKVTLDADVAMEMAMSACRTHGWTLPEPQGEPPLNQTGAFPAVPPQDATQVIPAVRLPAGARDAALPADALGLDNGAVYADEHGMVWQWFGEWVVSLDGSRQVPILHNEYGYMKADAVLHDCGPLTLAPDAELLATLCTACNLPMVRESGESSWIHVASGLFACPPADLGQVAATPAVTTPDADGGA